MTRKAKVKKWIKRILIVIAVLLGLVWAVYDNLVSNSVYYAKYTPHKEGVEPQLMMVIEHLDDIYLPEMKEYSYDFDGGATLQFIYDNPDTSGFFSVDGYDEQEEYSYSMWRSYYYIFNSKFRLTEVFDFNQDDACCDISRFSETSIKEELKQRVQPLIDAQPLPDVNLQWLFDWVYHDKFN